MDPPDVAPRANPPTTVGIFTNVPAPGSPIRSDWPQQAADVITKSVDTPTGGLGSPYVGGWPTPTKRITLRAAHVTVTTSAFGDAFVAFPTPFPTGVIAVTVTPTGNSNGGIQWWAMIHTTSLTGFQFWAMAPQGTPYATGHPPSQPSVWTLPSGPVILDYIAIGV